MSTRSRSSVPASAGRPLPSYRRHRASGQAVVSFGGHDVYLGPHGSETSRREYDRLIAEYLAVGRRWPPPTEVQGPVSIDELILRYWEEHVTRHYVKAGAALAKNLVQRVRQWKSDATGLPDSVGRQPIESVMRNCGAVSGLPAQTATRWCWSAR